MELNLKQEKRYRVGVLIYCWHSSYVVWNDGLMGYLWKSSEESGFSVEVKLVDGLGYHVTTSTSTKISPVFCLGIMCHLLREHHMMPKQKKCN